MGNESSSRTKLDTPCVGCKTMILASDSKHRKCAYLGCPQVYCGNCKKDFLYKKGRGLYYCGEHHLKAGKDAPTGSSGAAAGKKKSSAAPQKPLSARAPPVKREPPTPAMTPGTSALYNPTVMNKRTDVSDTPTGFGGNGTSPLDADMFAGTFDMNGQFGYPPGMAPSEEDIYMFDQLQSTPQPLTHQMSTDSGGYDGASSVSGGGKTNKRWEASKTKASELLTKEKDGVSPRTAAAAREAARQAAMEYAQQQQQHQQQQQQASAQRYANVHATTAGTTSINSVDLLAKMLETKSDASLMIHGDLDTSNDGSTVRPRYWTDEEDAKLKKAVEQYGAKNWKTIATFVPGRTHVQCLQRWNKVLKPGLRKGAWTDAEDGTLTRLVNEMQPDVNWGEIANHIPGRSAKQCRERWSFNLDPSINKSEWTEEEDEILLKAQADVGNKWSQIAAMLPGRTENAIKTRFKSILRAKKREWRPTEDALLLKYHEELGNKWQEIADRLPNRTKNAVKTRFKFLTEEHVDTKPKKPTKPKRTPEEEAALRKKRQNYVRTGASQHAKAQASTAEARARARVAAAAAVAAAEQAAAEASKQQQLQQMQMPAEQQMPLMNSTMLPANQPNFSPQLAQTLFQNNPSISTLNSISMHSLTRSNRSKGDSKVMLNEMLEDLANMEFEQTPGGSFPIMGPPVIEPDMFNQANLPSPAFDALRQGQQQQQQLYQQQNGAYYQPNNGTTNKVENTYNSAFDDLNLDEIL